MKKKLLLSALTLSAASVLVTTPMLAAQHQQAESKAKVNFTAPEDVPEILDPETLEPGTPEDGNVTGNKGPLSLDFVSNIDFGTHEISTAAAKYESVSERPYIQVSDRRGTGQGWSVSAQASHFTQDGTDTLEGAVISFLKGEATSPVQGVNPPLVNNNIVLNTGGDSASVVNAEGRSDNAQIGTAQGLGTWIVKWLKGDGETNEKVTLDVPQGAASAGEHTSTITWTLYDGPGNQ